MEKINNRREAASRILTGKDPGLVAIVGPCSDHKSRRIINEGRQLAKLNSDTLVSILRMPPWKPRTPRADGSKPWEGLETTNQGAALSRIVWAVTRGVPVAIELGRPEHTERYAQHLTFAWIGARSIHDTVLLEHVGTDPIMMGIPLGFKNNMRGVSESSLEAIQLVNKSRTSAGETSAASVPIFRGGKKYTNHRAWDYAAKSIIERTQGRVIIDTAHGSEMAHHRQGLFEKSVNGQRDCAAHVLRMAEEGYIPTGIMMEASDSVDPNPERRTDPNMPFNEALYVVEALHSIAVRGSVLEFATA